MTDINQPTPALAAAAKRWSRNRAFVAGEDAVKAANTAYLPLLPGMENAADCEYKKYLFRTPFFAGAARVKDGIKGLIFRKAPAVIIPPSLQSVFDTITPTGHTFNDLAEDVVEETLITGFTGLLIDHPSATAGLTLANAISSGFRPFIAVYAAESILEVTPAVVGNVQKVVRVRLLDDEDTVRELLLLDGIYQVIIHRKVEGQWVAEAPVIPTKKGMPLTDIPFVLVSNKARSFSPVKAPLDDVVLANLHAYIEGADAKNSRYYSASPILHIDGTEAVAGLVIAPGAIVQTPDSSAEKPASLKYVEFNGSGQGALESAYKEQKEEMAMQGLRMLASEAKGVEAAETHAIRRASENSITASFARRVSDRLEDAANWVSWWLDGGEVSVNLSTDFLPSEMSEAEMKQWGEWLINGVVSDKLFYDRLKNGEKLPEDFNEEEEIERRAQSSLNADRPSDQPEA